MHPSDPDWPRCACGCGEPVPARKANQYARGYIKGEPCGFVAGHSNRPRIKLPVDGRLGCSKCGETKPIDEFNRDGGRPSGYDAWCRACGSAKHRAYNVANREKRTARARIYRAANPAPAKAANRRYWSSPQGLAKARLHASARRARLRDQFVEHVDAFAVYERDEGICGICGDPVPRDEFHVDHVIPLVRGGEHSYSNVQVAHPSCNSSKKDKMPEVLNG